METQNYSTQTGESDRTKRTNGSCTGRLKGRYTIGRLFIPQRTQPPHIGHISMLEAACGSAREVIIGIGSANKYDAKNPYTAEERELMLRKSLADKDFHNYRFIHVPDFEDDNDWVRYVSLAANIDKNTKILSGNDWVQQIFKENEVLKPRDLIRGAMVEISATRLRELIVHDDPEWKNYAATGTLHYFDKFGGKDRIARFYQ